MGQTLKKGWNTNCVTNQVRNLSLVFARQITFITDTVCKAKLIEVFKACRSRFFFGIKTRFYRCIHGISIVRSREAGINAAKNVNRSPSSFSFYSVSRMSLNQSQPPAKLVCESDRYLLGVADHERI